MNLQGLIPAYRRQPGPVQPAENWLDVHYRSAVDGFQITHQDSVFEDVNDRNRMKSDRVWPVR